MLTSAPIITRLRKLADAQQKAIDHGRRPSTQNPTPKRRREELSRRHQADNLERAQQAMRALADAWEKGTVPPLLAHLKTKIDIEILVCKGLRGGGYYDVIPSDEYMNKSPVGVAMQKLLEASIDPKAAEAKAKADELRRLEQAVDFRPIPGFFPTPKPLVARMIDAADLRPGHLVLEPSAGRGDIADEVAKVVGVENVHVYELIASLRDILVAKGYDVLGADFLVDGAKERYDCILMNPPFERGQDCAHVHQAFHWLKPGGRLVAIMSEGSFFRSGRHETVFREWLDRVGGKSEKIPSGAFQGKDSSRQTGVATRLVIINNDGGGAC